VGFELAVFRLAEGSWDVGSLLSCLSLNAVYLVAEAFVGTKQLEHIIIIELESVEIFVSSTRVTPLPLSLAQLRW